MRNGKVGNAWLMSVVLILIGCFIFISGCGSTNGPKTSTEYQAVFLDNGQVFFGKLENGGSNYPLLRDVFYVQTVTDPNTKQVRSILIKRGNEWHGPDVMNINSRHIVVVEPVSPTSKVAQLINEAKTQKPAGQ